jgi:hypothetical protein
MSKLYYLIILISTGPIFALERAPWFGDVYEFHFYSKYTYSYYNKVNNEVEPLKEPSNDHLLHFNLAFAPSLQWSLDSDLEFAKSPRQDFGFCSVAFQARYLLKDDIIGDPVSICFGSNFRITSQNSLRDVGILYHSNTDFELNLALGKEFSKSEYWRFRLWMYGSGGIANRGSPWIRGKFSIEGNMYEKRKWALFVDLMQGYGRKEHINVYDFHGYFDVRECNVDIGFKYGVRLNVWGTLSFEYKRRVLAKSCPENVNFFTVSYLLPFSF